MGFSVTLVPVYSKDSTNSVEFNIPSNGIIAVSGNIKPEDLHHAQGKITLKVKLVYKPHELFTVASVVVQLKTHLELKTGPYEQIEYIRFDNLEEMETYHEESSPLYYNESKVDQILEIKLLCFVYSVSYDIYESEWVVLFTLNSPESNRYGFIIFLPSIILLTIICRRIRKRNQKI